MKTIVAILLAMLIAISGSSAIDEEALLRDLKPDKESVATFIEDNFSLFVQKCNETSEDGSVWDATGIESKQLITVYTTDSIVEGLFLDFSEDDGYAILGDDYIMYDFQTKGNSPYAEVNPDEIIYSIYTGYGYFKDGEFHMVNETYVTDDAICSSCCNTTSNAELQDKIYTSTWFSSYKYGLNDLNEVVAPRKFLDHIAFGKSYDLYEAKSLNYVSKKNCSELSVYKINEKDGSDNTEGNCAAVAVYNVLQYYANNIYTSQMPSSSSISNFDPSTSEPKTYNSIYDEDGNNISKTIKCKGIEKNKYVLMNKTLEFPDLYIRVREQVDKYYGSSKAIIEGIRFTYQIANVLEKTANSYGVNIDADANVLSYLYTSLIPKLIKSNNTYILTTKGSAVFGTHAMMGCGYAIYKKTTKIWRLTFTDYKFFYEVKDGWFTDLDAKTPSSVFVPAWSLGDCYSDLMNGYIQLIFTYAL